LIKSLLLKTRLTRETKETKQARCTKEIKETKQTSLLTAQNSSAPLSDHAVRKMSQMRADHSGGGVAGSSFLSDPTGFVRMDKMKAFATVDGLQRAEACLYHNKE
jgi:hypothetical protein